MANLMNLNDDSMRLIFDQLDVDCPQSFKQLALVSKGAKRLADSFRWRSITLSDDGPLSATSEQLIMLLLDTNHDLSKHVRQITVSDFKGDKDWFKLEQVLCNLKYLQSFAWNANRHIPEDFISTLENWWPDANLFVNNLRRPEAERESIPLDWRLLGSPSLYSLTCLVFLYDTVGDLVVDSGATNYILRPRSELEAVRRVLVGKSRLRILKLEIASTESWNHLPDQVFAIRSVQYWQQDNLNLPLQAEDRLPPLREFNLPGKAQTKLGFYDFTPEHCKALEYSMDWSRLRCLDLGNRCPPHFFKRFCGRLPNLRSLYIGLRKAPYNGCIDGYDDPAIVIDFINSIDRLESLSIINESMDWNVLLPAISKQAKSLQSLTARAPVDLSRYHSPEWRNSDLEKLAGVWKGLEQLEIDMNDEVFEQFLCDYSWPVSFSSLKTVKIFVLCDISGVDEECRLDIQEPIARDVESLFHSSHQNRFATNLQRLDLCFIERSCGRAGLWTFSEWGIEVTRGNHMAGGLLEKENLDVKKGARWGLIKVDFNSVFSTRILPSVH